MRAWLLKYLTGESFDFLLDLACRFLRAAAWAEPDWSDEMKKQDAVIAITGWAKRRGVTIPAWLVRFLIDRAWNRCEKRLRVVEGEARTFKAQMRQEEIDAETAGA